MFQINSIHDHTPAEKVYPSQSSNSELLMQAGQQKHLICHLFTFFNNLKTVWEYESDYYEISYYCGHKY